jgi:structural maintenance of chromosome 1
MTPNMKAIDKCVPLQSDNDETTLIVSTTHRLNDVEAKLASTDKEFEKARKDARAAKDEFNEVKKRRHGLFTKAFQHISAQIDKVYKDLTKGRAAPMGGVAYLSLEDDEACIFLFCPGYFG